MQNVAFILIGLGVLALIGWGVKGFFLASEIPLVVRAAVGAISAGFIILIGVAIRDHATKSGKDDFREIKK